MTSPAHRASLCLIFFVGLHGCSSAPREEADQDRGLVDEMPAPEPLASCPADSGGELSVEGRPIEVTRVIGDTTTIANTVLLQLISVGSDGSETVTFVTLDGLARGRSTKLSPSTSIEYREYATGTTQKPPAFSETYRESALSGSLDVIRVAKEPDEMTCGTFALVTTRSRAIVVKGRFRMKLLGAQPG